MQILKQKLLARLHRPAEDGADLGGTSGAIDSMGLGDAPAAEQSPAQDPSAEMQEPTGTGDGQDGGQGGAPAEGKSETQKLLDSLTEGYQEPAPQDGAEVAKAKDEQAPVPKTEDAEEAELLAGVKSERGRERISRVLAERKQMASDIADFKQLVQSSGMSAQEFSQSLEFGRLVTSNDPANLQVALEMLEQQRTELYARMGKEAPGVDLLKDHPDLAGAVDSMEMDRARAVELAKYRRMEAQQRQTAQLQQQSAQQTQQFQQTVSQAASQMDDYLRTRATEVDHMPRVKALQQHFSDPAKMQEFVGTFEPHQWVSAIKMMYDNVKVVRPAEPQQRPMRANAAVLGTPSTRGMSNTDKMLSRLDSMGI